MKLRSYNKAQCPPRHVHRWTTNQQVGYRQHKRHAILAALATGTVNNPELSSSSGCRDLHVLPACGHWCPQPCKSWLHPGPLQCAEGAAPSGFWHPTWAELTDPAFLCQGCEWYLSSYFQEACRNLAFSTISIPLVILAEIGRKRGGSDVNRQTDVETVISYAWLPKETWLQIEVRFAAAKSFWGDREGGKDWGGGRGH